MTVISEELATLSLLREEIVVLDREFRDLIKKYDTRARKQGYAFRLSSLLARRFAEELRPRFPGILPELSGAKQKSLSGGGRKPKKIDVNYSHPQIGLGLAISIKTINFRDPQTKRYTKNYTRVDNEWRAEASDVHQRQPYALVVGILFLPIDALRDAKTGLSSFEQALNIFQSRGPRPDANSSIELMERVWLALYDPDGESQGKVEFFDVSDYAIRHDQPVGRSFEEVVASIEADFERRNPTLTIRRRGR